MSSCRHKDKTLLTLPRQLTLYTSSSWHLAGRSWHLAGRNINTYLCSGPVEKRCYFLSRSHNKYGSITLMFADIWDSLHWTGHSYNVMWISEIRYCWGRGVLVVGYQDIKVIVQTNLSGIPSCWTVYLYPALWSPSCPCVPLVIPWVG